MTNLEEATANRPSATSNTMTSLVQARKTLKMANSSSEEATSKSLNATSNAMTNIVEARKQLKQPLLEVHVRGSFFEAMPPLELPLETIVDPDHYNGLSLEEHHECYNNLQSKLHEAYAEHGGVCVDGVWHFDNRDRDLILSHMNEIYKRSLPPIIRDNWTALLRSKIINAATGAAWPAELLDKLRSYSGLAVVCHTIDKQQWELPSDQSSKFKLLSALACLNANLRVSIKFTVTIFQREDPEKHLHKDCMRKVFAFLVPERRKNDIWKECAVMNGLDVVKWYEKISSVSVKWKSSIDDAIALLVPGVSIDPSWREDHLSLLRHLKVPGRMLCTKQPWTFRNSKCFSQDVKQVLFFVSEDAPAREQLQFQDHLAEKCLLLNQVILSWHCDTIFSTATLDSLLSRNMFRMQSVKEMALILTSAVDVNEVVSIEDCTGLEANFITEFVENLPSLEKFTLATCLCRCIGDAVLIRSASLKILDMSGTILISKGFLLDCPKLESFTIYGKGGHVDEQGRFAFVDCPNGMSFWNPICWLNLSLSNLPPTCKAAIEMSAINAVYENIPVNLLFHRRTLIEYKRPGNADEFRSNRHKISYNPETFRTRALVL